MSVSFKIYPIILTITILSLSACGNNKQTQEVEPQSETETVETIDIDTNKDDDTILKPCIKPEVEGYSDVGCLHNGLAGVIKDEQGGEYIYTNNVGYVDKDGNIVIPLEYDSIMAGEGGENITFNDFSEGLAVVYKNDKYGTINTKGKIVIPFEYDYLNPFSNGLAVGNQNGLAGAINKKGDITIPFEYESLQSFNDGVATASKSNNDPENWVSRSGLINKSNEEIIPFIYDEMGSLSEGLIAVKKDDKWGYVDKSNNEVIPIVLPYADVGDLSDGLAVVFDYEDEYMDSYMYGYIDKQGELVIPIQYHLSYGSVGERMNFKDGFAVVTNRDGEETCINKKGVDSTCPEGVVINAWMTDTGEESVNHEGSYNVQLYNDEAEKNIWEVTGYLVLQPATSWTWEGLSDIPNVQNWINKTPQKNEHNFNSPNYSISAEIDDNSYMAVYGSHDKPKFIYISSAQGVMESEELEGVYDIEQIFRPEDLTPLASNCELNTQREQHFYIWQKPNYEPLYVYAVRVDGNSGSTSEYGVAKSVDEFFKPIYDEEHIELYSMDSEGNNVVCNFDE